MLQNVVAEIAAAKAEAEAEENAKDVNGSRQPGYRRRKKVLDDSGDDSRSEETDVELAQVQPRHKYKALQVRAGHWRRVHRASESLCEIMCVAGS